MRIGQGDRVAHVDLGRRGRGGDRVLPDQAVELGRLARLRQRQHLQLDGIGLHRDALELDPVGIEEIARPHAADRHVRGDGDRIEPDAAGPLRDEDLAERDDLGLHALDELALLGHRDRDAVNGDLLPGQGGRQDSETSSM